MADNEVIIETQDVPLAESSMAEYKKARSEGKETATRETVTEAPPEQTEKPKAKGGFQARIDRLIKQQAALEERATAAEKRAAELEAKKTENGVPKTEQTDGEPQRESFQTEAEYIRALTRWEVRQEVKSEREAAEKQSFEAHVREARGAYNSRMIALQEETPEYKELMKQDISIPSAVEGPITLEMENGPEVAIYLAQNPEFCQELIEMTPSRAIAEVWKISEKLAAGEVEEVKEEEPEEKPKAAAAEEKPKLRPIRPVSSGSSRSTIPLDKSDFQAYKKLRAQGRVQ